MMKVITRKLEAPSFTNSCPVGGLRYLEAETTQFNLMGITLDFAHRKEGIWLAVAPLNSYFWLRIYQRLPLMRFALNSRCASFTAMFSPATEATFSKSLLKEAPTNSPNWKVASNLGNQLYSKYRHITLSQR